MKATAAQNEAYRQGLCVGLCGRRYSAGRNRCETCFAAATLAYIEPELKRRGQ